MNASSVRQHRLCGLGRGVDGTAVPKGTLPYIGATNVAPKEAHRVPLRDAQGRERELPMNAVSAAVQSPERRIETVDRRGIDMEKSMPRKFSCWLGLCVAAALFAPAGASAATLPIETGKARSGACGASVIEKAVIAATTIIITATAASPRLASPSPCPGGYGRCSAWRHECASRWGWGGHGYGRCLWRHGC